VNKSNLIIGLTCTLGGVAVLLSQVIKKADWLWLTGLGIYFIGKGLFATKALEYLRAIKEK
jgi:hypothetical protein